VGLGTGPGRQPDTYGQGQGGRDAFGSAPQQEALALLVRDVPVHLLQELLQDLRGEGGLGGQGPPHGTRVAGGEEGGERRVGTGCRRSLDPAFEQALAPSENHGITEVGEDLSNHQAQPPTQHHHAWVTHRNAGEEYSTAEPRQPAKPKTPRRPRRRQPDSSCLASWEERSGRHGTRRRRVTLAPTRPAALGRVVCSVERRRAPQPRLEARRAPERQRRRRAAVPREFQRGSGYWVKGPKDQQLRGKLLRRPGTAPAAAAERGRTCRRAARCPASWKPPRSCAGRPGCKRSAGQPSGCAPRPPPPACCG